MATLYLDEDVTLKLVPHLESFGHTVHTTRSEGRAGSSDSDQLLHAIQQHWILVTNNHRDFRMLHEAIHRWAEGLDITLKHHGIVVLNQS